VRTAVSEGEVEVSTDGNRLRLRSGQSAGYDAAGLIVQGASLPAAAVAAWREGDIVLERQPAEAAIQQIARYYPGRVWVLGTLAPTPVSGVFRSERAEAGIRSVATMVDARVWKLPGNWLLVQPATKN
ncbi:MAG: histidine kinase, partial [Stenotrophomonas sp.]